MMSTTTATTYLITGGSSGIGLEMATQILSGDSTAIVFATARSPSTATALQALASQYPARVEVLEMDVRSLESVQQAYAIVEASSLASKGIDYLISNAGVWKGFVKTALDPDVVSDLIVDIETNLYGNVHVATTFIPLVRKSSKKVIWFTSSASGSFGFTPFLKERVASYAASKAALNMYVVKLAYLVKEEGVTCLMLHPGMVRTPGLGDFSPEGEFEVMAVDDCVRQSLETLRGKTIEDTGKWFTFDDKPMPW